MALKMRSCLHCYNKHSWFWPVNFMTGKLRVDYLPVWVMVVCVQSLQMNMSHSHDCSYVAHRKLSYGKPILFLYQYIQYSFSYRIAHILYFNYAPYINFYFCFCFHSYINVNIFPTLTLQSFWTYFRLNWQHFKWEENDNNLINW